MTRKDYILIAARIKEARMHWITAHAISEPSEAFRYGIESVALELALALAQDNPRFDRERFLKATGVQS